MNSESLRNSKPIAIIDSVGFSFEKPPTLTGLNHNGSLLASSMEMALNNMQTPGNPDLIILHCPGTAKGDEAELNAVKSVFKNDIPALFSNKWKIGHTYAASAPLSLELGLLCLTNNFCPSFPYKTEIPDSKRKIRKVMINSTGFGGNATSIIVSNPDFYNS